MRGYPVLTYALFAAVLSSGAPSAWATQELDMSQIHITISGTSGAEFAAQWRITQDDEVTEYPETKGTVPAEYTFEGEILEGSVKLISDDERLEVAVVKGHNRSHSSTQGKGGVLTLHIR